MPAQTPHVTSPKIEQFLASTDAATPFVVVDVDRVAERYDALTTALPGARVYYAVKANPGAAILRRLVECGSAFDVASPAEIDFCLAAGASAGDISYGNTIKKRRDIAFAARAGVRRFTVDCLEELHKVADVLADSAGGIAGTSICVRLRHECAGADWPLSRKFGCEAPDVENLLVAATELGMECGVSFHVGSQQRNPLVWNTALASAAAIFREMAERGIQL
ncbi:MAG TPA: ornithine decarboxylase, partial [Ilumatobacteraceae bacterium]|nr:ornithine decarboxylase [Ilumatobacteraceae bacterium]